ncbi:glycosyltransferase [Psychrobacillus sp. OK032]|uniref:glycosyltransferase n=1 Tax=Psychrobacillus sp. OK032 TaxID=1884358 RepID=UPI0008D7C487|nr:glycosyltransferase [Psychrobacillus sp. OK032]SER70898.1 Glycosyltransferase involved in cell wall bisynthesis [Psychrobacillus sp. OK032]
MKIKVLVFLFQLNGGGAERTVVNIINKLDTDIYDIVLVLGNDKNNVYIDLISDRVKIKFLYCNKLRNCLFRLRKCIIEENPTLIFTTMNPNNLMVLFAKILSFKSIPVIIREANNRTQSGKVTKFNKFITTIFYNTSNKVVALSQGVSEDLIENFKIKTDKIKVIYNPVDIDNINILKNEIVEDIEINKNEKLIISVGRLEEQKDFSTLIKAFSLVLEKINAKLIILGIGSQEKMLKELCVNLGIEDKVLFLGFKENPQKYVKSSDLFVLTSKWEGFGHVIVESMAVGTPVVVTDCKSGPFEIIKDNKYGLLTEVENFQEVAKKIIAMLENDEMRSWYSKQGLKRSSDFNSNLIVKEYEELFTKVINSKVR